MAAASGKNTGKWTFELKKPEESKKLRDPLGYNASTDQVVILYILILSQAINIANSHFDLKAAEIHTT